MGIGPEWILLGVVRHPVNNASIWLRVLRLLEHEAQLLKHMHMPLLCYRVSGGSGLHVWNTMHVISIKSKRLVEADCSTPTRDIVNFKMPFWKNHSIWAKHFLFLHSWARRCSRNEKTLQGTWRFYWLILQVQIMQLVKHFHHMHCTHF